MSEPRPPTFLERRNYRRRRAGDAARLLPVLGLFVFILPLFWGDGRDRPLTSEVGLYLFAAWGVLVLIAAWLSRRLMRGRDTPDPKSPGM